ncbi:cupin domain-containing protein [candidate division WOR-3 bacterium]|nr:cupin domain-containing protein [candidate division WOR-3 bacterium]
MAKLVKQEGKNFTAAHLGDWDELDNHSFKYEKVGFTYPRKLFLKDALGLTGMEVSLNKLRPGEEVPFFHMHRGNEELYIFVKGKGQFMVDGEIIEVGEGTTIRVAPRGIRVWRNNSSEDLYYIVVQAKADTLPASDIADGKGFARKPEWPED